MKHLPARDEGTALNVWRFSSIISTAVTMTAALAHLMEMAPKLTQPNGG